MSRCSPPNERGDTGERARADRDRQSRAFSHVLDVAPLVARAPFVPEAYNETFNVGADTPYTVLELARVVARAFEVEPNIMHLDPRVEVLHAFADHSKARKYFDAQEPLSLEQGIHSA